MPALSNPRWERFAQAIVLSLANGHNQPHSNGRAYHTAGYIAQGDAADVNASRLLRKAKPIIDRVRELQDEARKRLQPKIDLSLERIGRRLSQASEAAERLEMPAAQVQAELGIAKVFHQIRDENTNQKDITQTKTMQDLGEKLLQSIGLNAPSPLDVAAAVEANDRFISELEAIRDRALSTIDAT